MKKITEEAKFYKEKVKGIEEKEKLKTEQMKRQHAAIKKMENELMESGMSGGELEEMRKRAVKGHAIKKHTTTLDSKSRNSNDHGRSLELREEESEGEIEDRTQEHYEMLLADVGVLEKIRADHQKQIITA